MNIPNQITIARFFIAIVLFVTLSFANKSLDNYTLIIDISTVLFFIAGLSDFLDGYLARKYNLTSKFGRIADPLADKIVTGGVFIMLVGLTPLLPAWIVVIIVSREYIVTSLRGYFESQGISFGANIWGKIKMMIQSFCIVFILVYLGHFQQNKTMKNLVSLCIWVTLIMTLLSAYSYIAKAFCLLRENKES